MDLLVQGGIELGPTAIGYWLLAIGYSTTAKPTAIGYRSQDRRHSLLLTPYSSLLFSPLPTPYLILATNSAVPALSGATGLNGFSNVHRM